MPNQEMYQRIYGSAVDIVAVDDLIRGDFTAALQGEGNAINSCSAVYLHLFKASML